MINFFSETDFEFKNTAVISKWIEDVIAFEGFELGDINYIFCNDDYLHKLNVDFLQHDTLTDIISFDNSLGKEIHGEIYISVERVKENAMLFKTPFSQELDRVIIHGILHYCGYKDKTESEAELMRLKEDEALQIIEGQVNNK
ncbi:rRNA maturation RNase YbeY [Patiriisocius sp. Uisw_017]|jgi:rRNA maturation RNase YbeY|uniref:rRNA maturation RNase YbeY n=1 Tax=Patiriisocius sp. Uisw_017 TaxID=3230968 RepID=UPI0039E79035